MTAARRLDLKLGFACNNRCLFCAQGEKRSECASIPAERLADELRRGRRQARGLVLTGGEPTVYKHLLPLLRLAKRHGYDPIQLQTNGRMLAYPEMLRALIEAGVSEVSPSLHGPTADVHEALTRAPGSFQQSVDGIRNVAAAGIPMVTNSVITRSNAKLLAELVSLLCDLGAKHAQLAFVHPVGTAHERFDEVVPNLSDLVDPLRAARAVALERGMTLVTEAVPLCFLREMEELAVEARIPPTTVADVGGELDYSEWRITEGKLHGPPCEGCSARMRCEGPWREYPERRGWDEFQPL